MPNRSRREASPHRERAAKLAASLREARLAKNLSQQELATRAGVAVGTVRAIEGGRVVEPGYFTVLALANELGVDHLRVVGRARKRSR